MTKEKIPSHYLLESYDFELPEARIAMRPKASRDECKLLVYKLSSNQVIDARFKELHQFLPEKSLIVKNQTKVLPCRLKGQKSTGAKCEILILGPFAGIKKQDVLIKSSSKKNVNDEFLFDKNLKGVIREVYENGTFSMEFNLSGKDQEDYLEKWAKIPIPPYIRNGESDERDKLDYQTIYAKDPGSIAAPTAGLHFTHEVMLSLKRKNIQSADVTLHVGLGTFSPIKDNDIRLHDMHSEPFFVEKESLEKLNKFDFKVAVGTTSLRVLESIYCESSQSFNRSNGETDLFLYPKEEGPHWLAKSIEGLITNFHLPKSSLIILISSLIGREKTLELYQHAIKNKYDFYSYGDAMLILK